MINVEVTFNERLTEVNVNLIALSGKPMSGQDILDAVAEGLLLYYDNFDLEEVREEEFDS